MNKLLFLALLLAATTPAWSATPRELLDSYTTEAARLAPGFEASAQRGAQFYSKRFGVSPQMPACSTCHNETPAEPGRHAITGKTIQPLSPRAEGSRFSDVAKVEKWFRRNCGEVLGRACSAAEKADFLRYLAEAK